MFSLSLTIFALSICDLNSLIKIIILLKITSTNNWSKAFNSRHDDMSKWCEYVKQIMHKMKEWWLCVACMIYEWQQSNEVKEKNRIAYNGNYKNTTPSCIRNKSACESSFFFLKSFIIVCFIFI